MRASHRLDLNLSLEIWTKAISNVTHCLVPERAWFGISKGKHVFLVGPDRNSFSNLNNSLAMIGHEIVNLCQDLEIVPYLLCARRARCESGDDARLRTVFQ